LAEVLVPVGRHFFPTGYLDNLAKRIPPDEPGEASHVRGIAGVDIEGVHVAVQFSWWNGHLAARTAVGYDWGKGGKVAGDLLFRF
jgi:hypothetical protein